MQLHIVDHDGSLATIVDDVVVTDNVRYPAPIKIHVEVKLGRAARCANRDPGVRADSSLRPDVDPAAACEKNTRRVPRAARHASVHRNRLPAVAVRVQPGYALRFSVTVDNAHPDAVRPRPAGLNAALDRDIHCPGVPGAEMIPHDAVGISAGRGDGMAVSSVDRDIAVILMITIDTVGITALRFNEPAPDIDVDAAAAVMPAIDAVGQGTDLVGFDRRAFRHDFEVPDIDRDISTVPLMRDFKARSGVRRTRVRVADVAGSAVGRDGTVSNNDVDVAFLPFLIPGSDAGSSFLAPRRDVAVFNENVDVTVAFKRIGIDTPGAVARRGDGGIYNVDIDVAVVILAESPDAVATTACCDDMPSVYFDHDVRGACVCSAVDTVVIRALRLDAGVIHADIDIAGASAMAQGTDKLTDLEPKSVNLSVPPRRPARRRQYCRTVSP